MLRVLDYIVTISFGCILDCGCFNLFCNMCTCICCVLYCLCCFFVAVFLLGIFILIWFVCTSVRTTATK
jgi:hypothetical protein